MVCKILIIVVVILIYVFYRVYLKDFIEVRKTFMTLKKFLSTRDALLLFQKANAIAYGLAWDGICGPKTWRALLRK